MEYLERLEKYLSRFHGLEETSKIHELVDVISDAKRVLVVGNGGSMATASHFAEDLLICGVLAQSISDAPYLTMAANDNGYSAVFLPYVRMWLGTIDTDDPEEVRENVILGISTSGNSGNVINALMEGQGKCVTLGLIGQRGSIMKKYCDYAIEVGTGDDLTEVRLAEDVHSVLCHVVAEYVKAVKGLVRT